MKDRDFARINTITPETESARTGDVVLQFPEMHAHEVAKEFGSDISNGLTVKAVRKNRARYGANIVKTSDELDFNSAMKRQYSNILTLLMLFGSLLVYVFQKDSTILLLTFGVVVLTLINGFLEYRAGIMLAEVKRQTSTRATVLRDGNIMSTDSRSVVCGDIICLEDGDVVPADARLIESNDLTVLETPLSGKTSATLKDALFIQKRQRMSVSENMVYAGSIVTGGSGRAVVCSVGNDVMLEKKKKSRGASLPALLSDCKTEGRTVTALVVVCQMFIIVLGLLCNVGVVESFAFSVGLGVVAHTDTAFAFSSYTFARCLFQALDKGGAVRNLDSVESISRVNSVMCDKETAFPPSVIKTDRVYDCFNEYRTEKGTNKSVQNILKYLLLCSTVKPLATDKKVKKNSENPISKRFAGSPTALSILETAEEMGLSHAEIIKDFYRIEAEFDSRGETSRVLGLLGGNPIVIVKGSPENVISRCAGYRQNGTNYRFDAKSRAKALQFAEEISKTRTPMAIAVGNTTADSLRDISVERKLVLIGFAGLYSTFELGAASAVFKCKQANIEILVSSDDTYYTSYNTAKNAGIIDSESEICTAEMMETTEEGLFIANSPRYKVYTGLDDAKWLYVEQLRRMDGKNVAVSVSKTSQLQLAKEANVSFAPKQTTVDAVLSACDVQMKNNGFDTIVETMKYARMATKRIMNTLEYFLVGFLTMFFGTLFSMMFYGKTPYSLSDIFIYGVLINVLFSLPVCFAPYDRNILMKPNSEIKIKNKPKYYLISLLYSFAGGVLCLISMALVPNNSALASLVTFALCMFFYSLMCGGNRRFIENKSYGTYYSFVVLAVVGAVFMFMSGVAPVASFLGYLPLGGVGLIVSLLGPLILFLAFQLSLLFVGAKKSKRHI